MIGTYVGLRGGDELPTLVRKTEPKPLRIFLQDGQQDLNIYGGDWWMANQTLNRALEWAGYEVEHAWGEDGHNHNHGAAIFPQAMRWLWKGFTSNDLVALSNGSIYVTDPESKQVWHINSDTHKAEPADTFDNCNGITVSPDQSLLFVADFTGRFIYSYQIGADGRLNHKQPYFQLHLPPDGTAAHADGMCTSREGWLLSATESGIQICDQAGRVNLIVPKPGLGRRVCYVRLHGTTLFAATADAVWKRQVKIEAAPPFGAPVTPPKPRL